MKRRRLFACGVVAAVLAALPAGTAVGATAHTPGFVTRVGTRLQVDGKPFTIAGTNNYYPMYKSRAMVDDVLNRAGAANFNVFRTWAWLDIGNADGSNSISGGRADGVAFQYWDGTKPAYDDGPNGLEHLDYVIAKAGQDGLRLVLPFTNNWSDFGGMDQYVRWRGGTHHDDFYTDPVIRQWYKGYISHLLNRVNTITGVAYKDDPTIMTWELANESRCGGSGVYPSSATCTTDTLTAWADDVSRYIKSIDSHHLVSAGDEGFFCDDHTSTDWIVNCGSGVDTVALAALPAMDVMSYHLYPDGWGRTADWGTGFINRHTTEAKKINKAVMLGEFGLHDKSIRNPMYKTWTDAIIAGQGNGFLYWILSGNQDDGTPYPDYDGFTVNCPSPVCLTLTNAGKILAGAPAKFRPVADQDSVQTKFDTPISFAPGANDVAYGNEIVPRTIDLRPDLEGQQRTVTVAGGTFTAERVTGVVTFTPKAGFSGHATTPYLIRDHHGNQSNVVNLDVVVKPQPGAPISLFSFEDGVQGWAPASWQTDAGAVAQTAAFHTDGASGLHITSKGPYWFGATLAKPVDISTYSTISFDLKTGSKDGTSPLLALQTGPSFTWCQVNKPWVVQDQSVTITYDIVTDLAGCPGLNDVRGLLVFYSSGDFDMDNVRIS